MWGMQSDKYWLICSVAGESKGNDHIQRQEKGVMERLMYEWCLKGWMRTNQADKKIQEQNTYSALTYLITQQVQGTVKNLQWGGREQWNIRVGRKCVDSIITHGHSHLCAGKLELLVWGVRERVLGSACSISAYPDLNISKRMITEWAGKKGALKRAIEAAFHQENIVSRHEKWNWDAKVVWPKYMGFAVWCSIHTHRHTKSNW